MGQILAAQFGKLLKKEIDEVMVADLQVFTEDQLCGLVGEKTGLWLAKVSFKQPCVAPVEPQIDFQIAWGRDPAKVIDRGAPKSILVELSFPSINATTDIYQALEPLVIDSLHRICEDSRRFNERRPTKLTIKWRRTEMLSIGSTVFNAPHSLGILLNEANKDPTIPP